MSERGGGAFDSDTVASEGSYVAALHAAGIEETLRGEQLTVTDFAAIADARHAQSGT